MLDLHLASVPKTPSNSRKRGQNDKWSPLEQGIIKLNYDGAAKGNPKLAGFGGVFRNAQGRILWIYEGNIGSSTNNVAELHALEHESPSRKATRSAH